LIIYIESSFLVASEKKVAYTIKKKKNNPINEIIDPTDAIKFHPAKQSGKSGIRLGIPANPKKCIGKKVKFTPTIVIQK